LKPIKTLIIFGLFFGVITSVQIAMGQELGGGVDLPGEWYVGEGLKQGDYFSYDLCHVDYQECAEFQMNFWVEGDITAGSETKWLVQVVVYDRNKIIKGNMELGKIAPEPTGGSKELSHYKSAFKSSIAWLSAFATADTGLSGKGPVKFSVPSWGKIANIGGQQIRPTEIQTIEVPGGTFESVLITWKTGGALNKVWVVDDFPFPVKAKTFTHVSEGIPPREYEFILLEYKENVQENPFSKVVSTPEEASTLGCPQNYEFVSVKKPTKNFDYLLEVKYGPENPNKGCNIEWLINFKKKFDETEFLNQVQYDILVVDDELKPLRSVASDEGKPFLYSPSGQVRFSSRVMEDPGTVHYVIWIYGLSPQNIIPSATPDYLEIDIMVSRELPPPESNLDIPSWIKNNARWWADGQIDDNSFVQGLQFLINQGIMKIPSTSQGSGTGSNDIPDWIRNNASWWADDLITDNDFVQGIQYLIEQGIMKIV